MAEGVNRPFGGFRKEWTRRWADNSSDTSRKQKDTILGRKTAGRMPREHYYHLSIAIPRCIGLIATRPPGGPGGGTGRDIVTNQWGQGFYKIQVVTNRDRVVTKRATGSPAMESQGLTADRIDPFSTSLGRPEIPQQPVIIGDETVQFAVPFFGEALVQFLNKRQ